MTFKRYAIYYSPPQGALATFGSAWLGWDLDSGKAVAHPELAGLDTPVAQITETPRKYGFHATLKPPFRLAKDHSFEGLMEACEKICATLKPVTLDGLHLSQIGRFLALTPVGDETELAALSASVVRAFDPFRGPQTDAELARRRAANLSPAQEENLLRWGYPYVMDAFHFHMTLTGKMPKSEIAHLREILTAAVAPHLPTPFEIRELTLAGEAEDGQFHTIKRFALSGEALA